MSKCDSSFLYKQQRERLLALIQSKVKDKASAEDILHDSFEKFEQCCQKGCHCEYPKSYLFKIALNKVVDFFNWRKRENEINEKSNCLQVSVQEEDNAKIVCDIYNCIYKELGKMSEENRQTYIFVDIEQRPQVEVASEMGIPLSTLKSRVQRTRKALRKSFNSCCPSAEFECV